MITFKEYFEESESTNSKEPIFKLKDIPQRFSDVDEYKRLIKDSDFFRDPANAKIIAKMELDSDKASGNTQVENTIKTYNKVHEYLSKLGISGDRILDYGAGLGIAARQFRTHSFEPNPPEIDTKHHYTPTYRDMAEIRSGYDGVVSLNVMNVLPIQDRIDAITTIGNILSENGIAIIQARTRGDVLGVRPLVMFGDESVLAIGSKAIQYQKGFTQAEFSNFVSSLLPGFEVYKPTGLKINGVYVEVKRK